MRIYSMAATSTTGSLEITSSVPISNPRSVRIRRRRISPEAGHALEILGHAIEYLTDEYVHEGRSLCAHDAEVEAVQLLMQINRKIYLDCPEVRSLSARCRELLHLRSA
jgi:hypothetical protein